MMNDLISRQAAVDALDKRFDDVPMELTTEILQLRRDLRERIPSAQPPTNCSEIPNNSDTISRQAAIYVLDEQIEQCNKSLSSFDISLKDEFAVKVEKASLVAFREILKYLPPAQPETATVTIGRTKGSVTMWYECDACGEPVDQKDNYCRNCGRKLKHE